MHRPLVGVTLDHYGARVFKASLASELPQGLCDALATAYRGALQVEPERREVWQLKIQEDQPSNQLHFSKKAQRDKENDNCVGGLRNPWRAMAKVRGWSNVGRLAWRAMQTVLGELDQLGSLVQWVGQEKKLERWHELDWARRKIGQLFGCEPQEHGLWGSLLERLVQLSGDPDAEAATWPRLGTPLGILNAIPTGGVFPKLEEDTRWEEARKLESLNWLEGASKNYKSYEESARAADALFQKEVDKGFVHWSKKRCELEATYGPLVQSAIGYIEKVKADGSVKGRLVHDLRRSSVNEHIELDERLVLPRMKDALEDVLRLLEVREPHEQVCFLSLDFSDAFKHLHVRLNEQRFLSGTALGGYFVYKTVLFGVRTGPLVWGRMAALVARSTQALFHSDRCRLQVFVDDPLLVARGTQQQLANIYTMVLLWWMILGLQIAWHKGTMGAEVEWIGARISVDNTSSTVTLTVTPEKLEDWRRLAEELDTRPPVSVKVLQKFAGKMSWASGFIPQLRPFVRMLYAALASKPASLRGQGLVYYKQIEPAMKWLRQLFGNYGSAGLERRVQAHARHQCRLDFFVDASPWGGGAVQLQNGQPVRTLALTWTREDEAKLGATIGSPGSQALWEAYMMLRCFWAWMTPAEQGFVRIRGDAQGALQALVKRAAISPLLNKVTKEVALHLAIHFTSLEALHVWSEDNKWADALSRGSMPPELSHLPRTPKAPEYWRGV